MQKGERWINSICIASYSIEKIIRRAEAIMLIKEMEKGTDKHAVKRLLQGMMNILNTNLLTFDSLEQNAIFDLDTGDKDFITVQNESILLSDCEDIYLNNANNPEIGNKSYRQGEFIQNNSDIKIYRANFNQNYGKIIIFCFTTLRKILSNYIWWYLVCWLFLFW